MRLNFYLTFSVFVIIVAIKKSGGSSEARCHKEQFTCKTGKCIRLSYHCDGDDDCGDDSDEVNCKQCHEEQFTCKSGKCISLLSRCDGQNDCRDGSDEANCNCPTNLFKCETSGGCIHASGVCNLTAECFDQSDEYNCPAPQETWEEYWHNHQENLTLAHADENVVFYLDSQTNSSLIWPFEIVSKAWEYVKTTYWSFEQSPRLFVILHTLKHGECHMKSYLHKRNGHQNILDCGRPSESSWDRNTSLNALTLLTNFGVITRLGAKKMFQNEDFGVCQHSLEDIVSYDVYTHVIGQTAGINEWKERKSSQKTITSGLYCFRDWVLPIYDKYGGALVLERFYSLTYLYGDRWNSFNREYFSMAQFIHFWSGAAQADLTSLAYTAFDWFDDGEMKKVRERHPQFSYPVTSPNATSYWSVSKSFGISRGEPCEEDEFRCQNRKCIPNRYVCNGDTDCEDLSDEIHCEFPCHPISEFACREGGCVPWNGVCNSTEECADGSDEFNCAGKSPQVTWEEHWHGHKENMTLVHADDHLVVYYDSNTPRSIEWPFSVLKKAWKYAKATYGSFGSDPRLFVILHTGMYKGCQTNSFLGERYGRRNVIDCGLHRWYTWKFPCQERILDLLRPFGHIIRGGAKGVIQNADATVCGDFMRDILLYDIYMLFSRDTNVTFCVHEELENNFWMGRNCFSNWYLPIYEKYGGASVLNNFYSLTYLYGNRTNGGIDFVGFNMAEFIHFWSGAAGADLTPLAKSSFRWENKLEMNLTRSKYPDIRYPLSNVISTTISGNTPSSTGPAIPPLPNGC